VYVVLLDCLLVLCGILDYHCSPFCSLVSLIHSSGDLMVILTSVTHSHKRRESYDHWVFVSGFLATTGVREWSFLLSSCWMVWIPSFLSSLGKMLHCSLDIKNLYALWSYLSTHNFSCTVVKNLLFGNHSGHFHYVFVFYEMKRCQLAVSVETV